MGNDNEYFEFPWFLTATIEQVDAVELFHDTHLRWPALDVDIESLTSDSMCCRQSQLIWFLYLGMLESGLMHGSIW